MTIAVTQTSEETVNWTVELGDLANLYAIIKAGAGVLYPEVTLPDFDPDQPGDFMTFQIRNNPEDSVYAAAGGTAYNFAITAQDTTVSG